MSADQLEHLGKAYTSIQDSSKFELVSYAANVNGGLFQGLELAK